MKNHIVHHHLTLYALGAPVDVLERQYKHNASYQRPAVDLHRDVAQTLHDRAIFKSYLGKEAYYHDFLMYFQQEIDNKGWQATLNEHLFKRDEHADDMLVRVFAGLLHPIIHLGFGVEFEQPAIIAEALAQAAVHKTREAPLLLGPERVAAERTPGTPSPSLLSLLRRAREDRVQAASSLGVGRNTIHDAAWTGDPTAFDKLAAEYTVSSSTMRAQLVEMIKTNAIFCFASQNPKHIVKTDFFYIHSMNCSIFFSRFLEADWLDETSKARLLEWKARSDLANYINGGSPELRWDEVTTYQPKTASDDWLQIFDRAFAFKDDGHVAKLLRALANGSQLTDANKVEDIALSTDDWHTMAHMTIDSAESKGPTYVRHSGTPEAWAQVPLRATQEGEMAKLS